MLKQVPDVTEINKHFLVCLEVDVYTRYICWYSSFHELTSGSTCSAQNAIFES